MEERYKRGWIRWMDTFQICKEQIEQNGDKPLPADLKGANGIKLKAWVANNRNLYRKGKLSEEQCRLLDSIHIFDVKFRKESCRKRRLNAAERKWFACYAFFCETLERYGEQPLPAELQMPDGSLLMHWVTLNQQYFQQEILPEERRKLLESVGILTVRISEIPSPKVEEKPPERKLFEPDENWFTDFNIAKKAIEEAGDTPVPADILGTDGRSIRKWCESNQHRYRKGCFSQECCELLNSIHIFDTLCTDKDAKWYELFLLCKEYVEETGRTMLPANMKAPNGVNLSVWLSQNRTRNLSAVRRRLLESVRLVYGTRKQSQNIKQSQRDRKAYIIVTDAEREQLKNAAAAHGYQSIDGYIRAKIAERTVNL